MKNLSKIASHPESHYLYHSLVESPEMMHVYNGNVVPDASGEAVIKVPDLFRSAEYEL